MKRCMIAVAAAALLLSASAARAQMRITEWMYSGTNGEYIELTNMSGAPVDMSGWYYSDSDREATDLDISAFGIVQPRESVILTETGAGAFRNAWQLGEVKIIGGNANSNLARNDEINIYHAGMLIDRLTFGDQSFPGSIRTQNASGNPPTLAALGANDVFQWKKAVVGDEFGSYSSTGGDIGNPGIFALVPEPGTLLLLALGCAGLRRPRRTR